MNPTPLVARSVPLVSSVLLVAAFLTTQPMQQGRGTPASEGSTEAHADSPGNTALTIRVAHLAPPVRVAADAQVYVVWVQPMDAAPSNVGVLELAKDLTGSLTTLTPHRRFGVLVTPEPSGQVDKPTHPAVFSAQVVRTE